MYIGERVVQRLASLGIDTLFGIPGKQSLPLNEAAGKRDDIDFVVARHETAVSHQAWGYAETSGRMAATLVIPGPGDMNAMNGLKNALNDCTPLLHIAIETEPELRGGDAIHETPPDTYDNVVKENILVKNPQATIAELEYAVENARSPSKGPVRIGIPKNFLRMDVPVAATGNYRSTETDDVPDETTAAAADLLAGSTTPIVLAGGGIRASNATTELVNIAEQLDAPVVTTYKGKGTIPADHELASGCLCGSASQALLDELASAETLLAVGTDIDAVTTRGFSIDFPDEIVHITLDRDDIGTGYDPTVAIIADATQAMVALSSAIAECEVQSMGGTDRARAIQAATEDRIEPLLDSEPLNSVSALRAIRESLPREAIVAADAGGSRVWGLNVFDVYDSRRYVNPGSWSTMGTSLPSAIGAKLANPASPVVAMAGDGGLMMCIHELHTIAAEDIPIVVIVFNNSDYAIISEEAGRSYDLNPQEYSWTDAPIDFSSIAEGMNVNANKATTTEEIRKVVNNAYDSNQPELIEIYTDPAEPQAEQWMSD
jgi:acetolactate synthase-1/2/3 large subunit